jgi:hypothetical protein
LRKLRRRAEDFFIHTEAVEVPSFGTGEAAEILGIPIWRLQKFLNSRGYHLSPTGKLGRGRGSRRVFSQEDLHRVALAAWLVKDGFAPRFVGAVMEQLDDKQVGVYIGDEGEEVPLVLAFYRGKEGPIVTTLRKGANLKRSDSPYYRVDLTGVFGEIDGRISKRRA